MKDLLFTTGIFLKHPLRCRVNPRGQSADLQSGTGHGFNPLAWTNIQWAVRRKMVTFNPGLSQILSKVFVSGIRMCNLSLQNTVVPSLRNKEMITQKVTVSNV